MTTHTEYVIEPRQHSNLKRGAHQITLVHSRDWARLWPQEGDVSPLFRLVTLPVRLVSLALLWATVTPGRLLFATALGAVSAVLLIR